MAQTLDSCSVLYGSTKNLTFYHINISHKCPVLRWIQILCNHHTVHQNTQKKYFVSYSLKIEYIFKKTNFWPSNIESMLQWIYTLSIFFIFNIFHRDLICRPLEWQARAQTVRLCRSPYWHPFYDTSTLKRSTSRINCNLCHQFLQ